MLRRSWIVSGFICFLGIQFGVSPAFAAISRVQSVTKRDAVNSAPGIITVNLSQPATAGNLLVACIATDKQAGSYAIPTTNVNTTSFVMPSPYYNANVSFAMAYKVADGGETSVTWDMTANEESSIWVGEYSGAVTSGVLDVRAEKNSGDADVNVLSTGATAETSQADELAIACFGVDSAYSIGTASGSWDNGFTELVNTGENGNNNVAALSVAEKTLSSTMSVYSTYSWDTNGGGRKQDQCAAGIMTFKAK